MKYSIWVFVAFSFLFCKNEKPKYSPQVEHVSPKENIDGTALLNSFLKRSSLDTIHIESEGKICFNMHLDSLIGKKIYQEKQVLENIDSFIINSQLRNNSAFNPFKTSFAPFFTLLLHF